MQTDFHYCAVKFLAHMAGFDEAEAETIAYASQYVDDATEHKGSAIADQSPAQTGAGANQGELLVAGNGGENGDLADQ